MYVKISHEIEDVPNAGIPDQFFSV
jgi:hypothetical protein